MTTHSIKNILAAMDNSKENRSLFKEALALASSMRAKVVVTSITPRYEGNMNRVFLNDAEKQLEIPLKTVLDEAGEYASSLGLQMSTLHRVGKPSDEISAIAHEMNADLILLGCSKRLQVERILLGRTTIEVICNGPCDVMLLPEDREISFERILVGINGSAESLEAGVRALGLASSYGGEVHAVYATDLSTDRLLRYGAMRDAEQKGWKILQEFLTLSREYEAPVITAVRGNLPESSLVEYAREKKINLIALGAPKEHWGLEMFFGSVIERITSLAQCPILIAKKSE
ncbi:universal stress protein [Desulfopila sp. IMCC35008]|uniref:universal stress protein n=1 Tax=Desulfopila sp. IMCC35008 TaxID=2653858 RepID=UPI0013D559FF|nr:universal stress protein [Desulfopila sp. IMCC35008]